MIGWEDDNEVVGSQALSAKASVLRLLPHILPPWETDQDLYHLVLEHGDVGTHDMLTVFDESGNPNITSLFDWETGCVVPTLLSDPLMAVPVDLVLDYDGEPSYARDCLEDMEADHERYRAWTAYYHQVGRHHPLGKAVETWVG